MSAREDDRRRVAAALVAWDAAPYEPEQWQIDKADDATEALMPTLDAIADERAAGALERAALEVLGKATGRGNYERVAKWLRDQAAALRARRAP